MVKIATRPDRPALPKCPRCGAEDFFYIRVILIQAYEEVYDETGLHLQTNEGIYGRRQSRNAVHCGACGKIRNDVKYHQGEVVARHATMNYS